MKKLAASGLGTTLLALIVSVSRVSGGPITLGDLVIYRVGDGAAALGTTATAVFLDEYTTAGAFVQSIALPTSGSGALTAVGNATTEGIISRSQDGNSLIFTGYRKDAGGTSPVSDAYTLTSRLIGTVSLLGVPDTSTTVTSDNGLTSANTIRSATTVDGTVYWVSTSSRVSYFGSGTGSSGGTVQIDARNSRQVNLSGNVLFASNGSTAIANKVQHYGTLPIGATSPTAVVTLGTADAVNGFALFDLDAGVAGDDTLYALSTVANQLLKYTYNGTTWTASGSISASSAANLAGYVNGSSVDLFLTSGSTLYAYSDTSGYGGTETGALTSIATAGANTAFRGIGIFPVPEPGSAGLVAIGLLSAALFRRARR